MIAWAPITAIVGWWTTTEAHKVIYGDRASELGLAALRVAQSEIGAGEFGGNNSGPDVERYRGPLKTKGRGSWCAAFIFWCLLQAVRVRQGRLPFKRAHGARKLFRLAVASGMRVDLQQLQPGDLVLWARGPDGSWKAHIGIVSRVYRDRLGRVTGWDYIAGNEGHYPARVKERPGHRRRLIGFARLP